MSLVLTLTFLLKGFVIMNISWLGGGERLSVCIQRIGALSECISADMLILPIPTTRDKRYVLGTDVELKELSSYVKPNSLVAGYGLPSELYEELSSLGAVIYDASLDEKFLSDNADISARGAFGYLLSNFKTSADRLKIGRVGYGRIGAKLSKLLLFAGADVKIYTTRMNLAKELCEHGIRAEFIKPTTELSELDQVISASIASEGTTRAVIVCVRGLPSSSTRSSKTTFELDRIIAVTLPSS